MAERVASGVVGAVANKTLTTLGKIKVKQWKAMGETVEQIKDFTDSGGMGSFMTEIKETISLQIEDALSPLKNEVLEAFMEALEPIMPLITQTVTDVTGLMVIAIKAWEATLTGKWEEFFDWMSKNMTAEMKGWKNDMNQFFYDLFNWFVEAVLKGGTQQDLLRGFEGFRRDVGLGWSGFWRDLGWF